VTWVAALCPLLWLAAFVAGRWVGLVPAIAAAAAVLTALALVTDGRAILRLFRPTPRAALAGLVAAVALVVLPQLGFRLVAPHWPALASSAAGLYARFPQRDLLYGLVIGGVVFAEEIIWRGWVQNALRGRILLSALVYAAAHVTSGSPLLVALALVLGAFWSWLRRFSGGLFAPALSHLAFDFAFLFVMPVGQ
jgi:membrane protease YdiL (CAAX protease family)